MANKYKIFYLDDLVEVIDRVTLDIQKEPNYMMSAASDKQLVIVQNAMIASFNHGVQKMRKMLIKQLEEVEEDDGGQEVPEVQR